MPKHRRKQSGAPKAVQHPSVSSQPYEVEFVDSAAAIYQSLHEKMLAAEKRGDTSSSHHTVFRMIEETIKVTIPRDPTNRRYGRGFLG
jgi:hypothetical protein